MIERVDTCNNIASNEKQPRAKQGGNMLKLHDAEVKLINSGPMGIQRLAMARSFDIQENFPDISVEDANKMGVGYVLLRSLAVSGKLTDTTRAEVKRLEVRD